MHLPIPKPFVACKDEITSLHWFNIVKRENSPYFNSLLRQLTTKANKELGFDNSLSHHLVLYADTFAVTEEFDKLKKSMIVSQQKDMLLLDKYFAQLVKDCVIYVKKAKSIRQRYTQSLTNKQLNALFEEFMQASTVMLSHLWPPLGLEEHLIQSVESELAKYIDPKKDYETYSQVLHDLLEQEQFSIIQERHVAILQLGIKKKKGTLQEQELLKKYTEFCWINDHNLLCDYESLDHFKKEIRLEAQGNPSSTLKAMMDNIKQTKKKKQAIYSQYKMKQQMKHLLHLALQTPHMRFHRLNSIIEGHYLLHDNFLQEIGKRLGLKNWRLAYYWEIIQGLHGEKLPVSKINARQKGHGLYVHDSVYVELSDKDITYLKPLIEQHDTNVAVLKGMVASKGYAKGKARVIHSKYELDTVLKGDILVTAMTIPDFVPAMERAAAIVTDEGGISCHAAIVSRELKKPCVIGTKIATKVFKSGEIIEVDAHNGIVRKI